MFGIVAKNKNKTPQIKRINKKQDQPTKQTKLEACIGRLSHCCGKMSRDHEGREVLFRVTVWGCGPAQQGHEAADHITSTVGKHNCECWCLAYFLLLIHYRTHSPCNDAVHIERGSKTHSNNRICKVPHRHSQAIDLSPKVRLGPVSTLAVSINNHSKCHSSFPVFCPCPTYRALQRSSDACFHLPNILLFYI